LESHEQLHKNWIDKSCEGVEPLPQKTLHPMVTHGLDLQITHQFRDAKKTRWDSRKKEEFSSKFKLVVIMEIGGCLFQWAKLKLHYINFENICSFSSITQSCYGIIIYNHINSIEQLCKHTHHQFYTFIKLISQSCFHECEGFFYLPQIL
jgi:hypothetical protein